MKALSVIEQFALKTEVTALRKQVEELNELLDVKNAALKRIAEYDGAPDIDAISEYQFGLHCGVEDRDCQDRYQGADYGHAVGVEKALEWAGNEAKRALEH